MKTEYRKHIRLRTVLVGFILSLCFVAIGGRAVYLQVFCENWLSQKAADQYERPSRSFGKRGTICDANHKEMAVSASVTSIAAYPGQIDNPATAAVKLSKILRIGKTGLRKKLSSNKKFIWIKRQVTPGEKQKVKKLKLKGIDFIPEQNRFYPGKTLAAQLLGFSGIDGHGLEGIEFYYDKHLKGNDDRFTVFRDALGYAFSGEKITDDYNGKNLILTIDRRIQYITEKALEEAVNEFKAGSGIAIVMVPQTGAILSLAHFPFFNPNAFNKFDRGKWRNRAITDSFEPGSTMKIFSVAAAIESGKCTPRSIFFCENGTYGIGKNIIHDTHPHGWLSLQHIIKYSSNIGAVKVGEMIGPEVLYNSLRQFGFRENTGIDCPGETRGSLLDYKRWAKIDAGAISFGQGISASSIQLISAASAIANNGILMKPYLVQAVTDYNGRLIKNIKPQEKRRVISPETAQTVIKMLKSVVSEKGTGINAAINGYSVCGKTGTAQKIDDTGKYAKGKYTASFIGFIPAEKPKAVILVIIDEPHDNHYGGIVAAPVFRKIALKTLDYMNMPQGRVPSVRCQVSGDRYQG
ncbi:MAG: penicillin-binding protein 2 [Deltaproteobacteria bacterium]|nr:penicillin-binding protein 2 [Deltaproteobacteria bacterium]